MEYHYYYLLAFFHAAVYMLYVPMYACIAISFFFFIHNTFSPNPLLSFISNHRA